MPEETCCRLTPVPVDHVASTPTTSPAKRKVVVTDGGVNPVSTAMLAPSSRGASTAYDGDTSDAVATATAEAARTATRRRVLTRRQ
jgi:hypothetical protein